MRLSTILLRSLRLRCPRCGRGKLFRGWFTMPERCATCGLRYEREPGYFLGSIYFNYGVTALVVTAAFFLLYFTTDIDSHVLIKGLAFFCLVFPIWFFRWARSLWMAFDELFDPRQPEPAVVAPKAHDHRCRCKELIL
ncbi:MAG TPA: DUF983 domain-containing protein [Pirellulales bacterium]|jgi:uncharacterized protein (DUF983 family)|nr:DUF983 domain-containing protein [Pirellulales bacterium]